MPYRNVPQAKWGKMERCVQQVMAQGHDKQSAIAICHTSIMSIKEAPSPQTGVMVAFFLAPDDAARLVLSVESLPPGSTPLPPAELHLTLALLGETADEVLAFRKNDLLITLAAAAKQLPALSGKVGGIGRFTISEGSDTNAFYASFDSPAIQPWRMDLVNLLRNSGFDLANDHGFTPHLTLAYIPAGADTPTLEIPPLDLTFDALCLAWGDEVTHFPLAVLNMDAAPALLAHRMKAALLTHLALKAEAGENGPARSGSRSSGGARAGHNWGARAGQTIRGNLTRGNDGKFASGGGGTTTTPATTQRRNYNKPAKQKPAKAPARKPAKTGAGSRGGKTDAQRAAERQQRAAEQEAARQKKRAEAEADRKKREAEREQKRQAAAAAKKPAGGGKGGADKKPAGGKGGKGGSDKAQEREKKARQKKIAGALGKLTAGKGKELTAAEKKLLLDEGLVKEEEDGSVTLTEKGKQAAAVAAAGKTKTTTKALAVTLKRAFDRAVGGGVDRDMLADSDFALPRERKFPVVTPGDVQDAVASWGRYRGSTSFETFKRTLTALARRKGPQFVERLPKAWEATTKTFTVFKQADGRYRWIGFSSNAFRDRDGEIVSTQALLDDVQRTDQDGRYGPLRWWHIGDPDPTNLEAPWGPGLDLGWCDYSAMHDRVLIESGTFVDDIIGEAVAQKAADLQLSIGFLHPPGEPDAGGGLSPDPAL